MYDGGASVFVQRQTTPKSWGDTTSYYQPSLSHIAEVSSSQVCGPWAKSKMQRTK